MWLLGVRVEHEVYKTMRVIERIVRSKPLSETNVWIKRSVVMKTGACVGFTTEWRA